MSLDESGTVEVVSRRKVERERKVAGAIKFLIVMGLQLECARVLHEALIVPVFIYGNETIIWKEKERSMVVYTGGQPQEVCWVLGEWIK